MTRIWQPSIVSAPPQRRIHRDFHCFNRFGSRFLLFFLAPFRSFSFYFSPSSPASIIHYFLSSLSALLFPQLYPTSFEVN